MPHTDSAQTDGQLFSSRIDCSAAPHHGSDESIAVLLHELRNPLASIESAMAVLRLCGKADSLQQRMHALIERQVRQMTLLTSSQRQMSETGVTHWQLQRERIDLRSVLSRAAETVAADFTQRLNPLVVTFPESSTWVIGDASRLEQVFVNLLSNAAKYSDTGGKVTMSMHVCDGHAVVQVRDSGVGIPTEAIPFIFGLFVRADSAAVKTRPGLGIGLALVRSILDSHGGTVSAASEGSGRGSEFTVRLNLVT